MHRRQLKIRIFLSTVVFLMFTSMGQAANYLCSEPELQELQIASETERAAWWTTSQSPPSSHTRCSFEKPLQRLTKSLFSCLVNILALFNCKFPFQFFSCKIFVSRFPSCCPQNRFWKWRQQRSGPFQTWPLPFPTLFGSHDFQNDKPKKTKGFVGIV